MNGVRLRRVALLVGVGYSIVPELVPILAQKTEEETVTFSAQIRSHRSAILKFAVSIL